MDAPRYDVRCVRCLDGARAWTVTRMLARRHDHHDHDSSDHDVMYTYNIGYVHFTLDFTSLAKPQAEVNVVDIKGGLLERTPEPRPEPIMIINDSS